MSRLVWLASYPKSGNTWFRLLVANLSAAGDVAADINDLPERAGIASGRELFDNLTLIESGLLTPEEAEVLRPRVYEALAAGDEDDANAEMPDGARPRNAPRLMKVHDAYTMTSQREPLLAAAEGAIVIVRDPRGIAASLANHLRTTIDEAIAFMASEASAFARSPKRQVAQMRQKLLSWSMHVESWLDQRDIAVHVIRYEDLQADTAGVFQRALAFAGRAVSADAVCRAVRLADFARSQAQEHDAGFREGPPGVQFFRRGQAESWRDELTPAQITRIESDHAQTMARLGYLPALGGESLWRGPEGAGDARRSAGAVEGRR